MFEILYIIIALVGLTACGLWDLKTSNIPDQICIPLIFIGIILHAAESLVLGSWNPITMCLIVGGLYGVFAFTMYYSGQWGDGDAAMLIALGVLVPTATVPTFFPFALTLFINMVFVSAIYSVIYVLFLVKNPKIKRKGLEFYRRIPTSKLIVDDVLGEDIPRLKLYQKKIRGLKLEEIKKIKKIKRYVIVKEGIRSGLVFPIALAITLYFGDLILFLV